MVVIVCFYGGGASQAGGLPVCVLPELTMDLLCPSFSALLHRHISDARAIFESVELCAVGVELSA